jgi:aldehyde dehydrogenase (NAD+)
MERTTGPRTPPWVTEMLIDGVRVCGTGPPIRAEDPATEQILAEVATASPAQVQDALNAARAAFDRGAWPRMSPADRCAALEMLADRFEARHDDLVSTVVSEVGTPIALARSLQVDSPLQAIREYARCAALIHDGQLGADLGAPASISLVRHRPAGVVAAIPAYNYPLLLSINKIVAALAAGCTVVAVPAPAAALSVLLLAEIFVEAGLPSGVVNVVVGGPEVGRLVTESPAVDVVSFTGSTSVGTQVAVQAAAGPKKCILELGGKSPNLLLPGTDLAAVVAPVHLRYLRNAGQGCASPTRILVPAADLDDFVDLSRRFFDTVAVGDPWDEATVIGPVISAAQKERVEGYVSSALEAGGEIVAGGRELDREHGWFVAPALIAGVDNRSRVCQEEIFGPIGVLLPYNDVEEAITIANDTEYGLAGNVYGPDVAQAVAVARGIRAGTVTVNGGGRLRVDAPFGGMKRSGIGREGGLAGVLEFLEEQHIQIALG